MREMAFSSLCSADELVGKGSGRWWAAVELTVLMGDEFQLRLLLLVLSPGVLVLVLPRMLGSMGPC